LEAAGGMKLPPLAAVDDELPLAAGMKLLLAPPEVDEAAGMKLDPPELAAGLLAAKVELEGSSRPKSSEESVDEIGCCESCSPVA